MQKQLLFVIWICSGWMACQQKPAVQHAIGVESNPAPRETIMQVLLKEQKERDSVYNTLCVRYKYQAASWISLREQFDIFYLASADLKNKFNRFCGDSTGLQLPLAAEENTGLTEKFVHEKSSISAYYEALQVLRETARPFCTDSLTAAGLVKCDAGSAEEEFRKKYLRDLPPVAFITIINSFENRCSMLEQQILFTWLKEKK